MSETRIPAEAFPLSDFLQEEMDERGWTLEDVVIRMGGNYEKDFLTLLLVMNIHEKNVFLGETSAKSLGKAFDMDPEYFLKIDETWRNAQ